MSATAPAARFACLMDGLLRIVAADGAARRLSGPLVVLIWSYLARLRRRVTARIASGPRPSRHRAPSAARFSAASSRLPRRFAWLRSLIPGTASAGAQLANLLAEPDMAALIDADPSLGRTLRPLCHLLGIRPPPSIRRPPRSAASAPAPRPLTTGTPAPSLVRDTAAPAPSRPVSRRDRSPAPRPTWTGPPPFRASG